MTMPAGWSDAKDAFVKESNRIEAIFRPVRNTERYAHAELWSLDAITVPDVESFVTAITGRARLRRRDGMNVRVGNHVPPPGGPTIEVELAELLVWMPTYGPFRAHVAYETLHPFTDGNGRSGRALWAWQMMRADANPFELGFLHAFYYQSLSAARADG